MKHFTPTQLLDYINSAQKTPVLLDVREPWEYEICHIANSTLIPMGQIHLHCDTLNKDDETIVICHHGIRSRQVAMYLESREFTNVVNLTGGVDAWAQDVDVQMEKY